MINTLNITSNALVEQEAQWNKTWEALPLYEKEGKWQ